MNAVIGHLREVGPCPRSALPRKLSPNDRMGGVTTFKITSGGSNSDSIYNGGSGSAVAYIVGEHDPEDVIRVFCDHNPTFVKASTLNGAVQRIGGHGGEWRDAARTVLRECDMRDPHGNNPNAES